MKKHFTLLLTLIVLVILLTSQKQLNTNTKFTEDSYLKFFPLGTGLARYTPTTDFVCILPTNEDNKELQSEVNEFYINSYIKSFPTIPNQIGRVITDKEALREDLSNINICAFGTVNGNLWISNFLKKVKDFPIKITSDSIIAEKTFKGNDYTVTALWYNPSNFKHSVFLFVPQKLESTKNIRSIIGLPQYSIWQGGRQINSYHSYIFKNNQWHFSPKRDSLLDLRDAKSTNQNLLERISRGYYRYPGLDLISDCKINNDDIRFDTLKIYDSNGNYINLADAEWLKPIAKNSKIVAIGESHHLKYNDVLLKRILFALNSYDYYPTLICELPYSYTGYFNYFLTLEDDRSAYAYRDSILTKIHKPAIPTIEAIRNWNKLNKNKLIQVGFSDLEHNVGVTIHRILNPYFNKIDSQSIPTIGKDGENIELYLEIGEKLIEQAKEQNIIGDFPFQTPEYMASAFENFKVTVKIILDPKYSTDFTDRYQAIIHNVTDEQFLGKRIIDGKSVFFGGYEHFRTLADSTNKKALTTEGYFLANKFEPTKGKVYSINMKPMAYSIEDSIQIIEPRLGFTMETELIKLYKERKIKLKEPVLVMPINELDKFVFGLSYEFPNYSFRIQKINLGKILSRLEGYPRYWEYILDKDLLDYNTSIFIPFSPVGN